MKSTGIVYAMRRYRGGGAPPSTTLEDASRYGADGTITGATWVQEPSGLWVLDFNPDTPSYVEIPASFTQLNFTSEDFSIIARVKVDDLSAARSIFTRGLLSNDGYLLVFDTTVGILFRTNQGAAYQQSYSGVGTISVDTWYTAGISRSGASAKMFVGGVDTTGSAGTHIDPATCARSVKIGVIDNKIGEPYDGKIEFLYIFNYALSVEEHANYHHMLSGE